MTSAGIKARELRPELKARERRREEKNLRTAEGQEVWREDCEVEKAEVGIENRPRNRWGNRREITRKIARKSLENRSGISRKSLDKSLGKLLENRSEIVQKIARESPGNHLENCSRIVRKIHGESPRSRSGNRLLFAESELSNRKQQMLENPQSEIDSIFLFVILCSKQAGWCWSFGA